MSYWRTAVVCAAALMLMLASNIAAFGAATCPTSVQQTVFATCIGGASGMMLQVNPSKGLVRGCAPKLLEQVLLDKMDPVGPPVPQVRHAYTRVRMQSPYAGYSEPNTSGWPSGVVKFSGLDSDCEIVYVRGKGKSGTPFAGQEVVLYALSMQKDSVVGLRWAVNRQRIYGFRTQASGTPIFRQYEVNDLGQVTVDRDALDDPDFACVYNHMSSNWVTESWGLSGADIPIHGGLTECYMDSGWRAIKEWNDNPQYVPNPAYAQPQLYAPNFTETYDNILSVAVLLVIYNKCIQEALNSGPLNITTQMERQITSGQVDNWATYFGASWPNSNMPLLNYYREPLSGTRITYDALIMRGLKPRPNNSNLNGQLYFYDDSLGSSNSKWEMCCEATGCKTGAYAGTVHGSGIPGIDCMPKPWTSTLDYAPGGGVVNDAVDWNRGGHAYTFSQKFTPVVPPKLESIRVAKINGHEPYTFDGVWPATNSLPGINGQTDVSSAPGFYQNVIDGKYPLWTYNHLFTIFPKGTNQYVDDFVTYFQSVSGAQRVREVGLIPLTDMHDLTHSGQGGGAGRAWSRCFFLSPITGEKVRDGMMMMQENPTNPYDPIASMPDCPYVEMRP